MPDRRTPPCALDAEVAVLGAALLSPVALNELLETSRLQADDFYTPNHQLLWLTIQRMWQAGDPVDAVTVAELLRADHALDDVGGQQRLLELQVATPAISRATHYATVIQEAALSRRLIAAGSHITDLGYEGHPLDYKLSESESALLAVQHHAESLSGEIEGLYADAEDMVPEDQTIDDIVPWVIPGLLRERERMIVVAGPGAGKSTFLRQLAHCAANGVHPWNGKLSIVSPRRAMIVELEAQKHNIHGSTRKTRRMIADCIGIPNPNELERVPVLHRPEGLNLRDPVDRSVLIEALRRYRPHLVCVGPLKYLYGAQKGETFDETAVSVQQVLNSLMVRFNFAVVMEAHGNKADSHKPSGSERWVDWPDLGFALTTSDDFTPLAPMIYDITPFRFPRNDQVALPTKLLRNGATLPWKADKADTNWWDEFMGQWTIDTSRPKRHSTAYATGYIHDPESDDERAF